MAFKYRARSEEDWAKRATASNDYEGIFLGTYKEYAVRKGDNWVRILPPTWDDPKHYGMDLFVHYNVGPDRLTVLCPTKMMETAKSLGLTEHTHGRCPICEAKGRAEKADDKERANELRWTKRVGVWMLDLKDADAGPQLWSMPQSVDVAFAKLARDPRSGAQYILDHPDQGFGITFEKEGEQLTTKYNGYRLDKDPSSVEEAFLEFIEEEPIYKQLIWRDYDTLKALYQGAAGAGAEAGPAPEPRREPDPRPSTPRESQREAPPREEASPALRQRGSARAESPDDESLRKDSEALKGEDPPFKEAAREPAPSAAASGAGTAAALRARFAAKK